MVRLALVLSLLAGVANAQTLDIRLSWDRPTADTEGNPLLPCVENPTAACLAGYDIYWSESPGEPYENSFKLNRQNAQSKKLPLPCNKTFYFAMKAFTNKGEFSTYSNELPVEVVCAVIPAAPVLVTVELDDA